jgi:parallel beta-helix repeat protein
MSPSQWYWLKAGIGYGLLILLLVSMAFVLWLVLDSATIDDIHHNLETHPFFAVLNALPNIFTDLILSPDVQWPSLIIAMIFWVLGIFAFKELKGIDFPATNSHLLAMAEYTPTWPWQKDKEKAPVPEKVGKAKVAEVPADADAEVADKTKKKKKTLRSEKTPWESVDAGEGVGAVVAKNRLMSLNTRPKLVTAVIMVVFTVALAMLFHVSGDMLFGILLSLPFGMILIVVLIAVHLPTQHDFLKNDIIRLLPLEEKKLILAYLKPPLKYGIAPYYVSMLILVALFQITEPYFLIVVLMLLPLPAISLIPISVFGLFAQRGMEITLDQGILLLYIVFMFTICFYLAIILTFVGLPLWGALAVISLVTLLGLPILFRMGSGLRYRKYMKGPRWRKRRILRTALAVGFLALMITVLPFAAMYMGGNLIPMPGPSKVAHEVDGYETIANGNYSYDGSLVVPAGTILTIENSTVDFGIDDEGHTGLYVDEAGWLNVYNSTITSQGYYVFRIDGTARLYNSHIYRTIGETGDDQYGGVAIYSDNVIIDNCTFYDSFGVGIYMYGSTSTVRNSTIRHNADDGIRIVYGQPIIEGNLIEYNGDDGVDTESETNAIIQGNRILNNSGEGVMAEGSFPHIKDNLIADNEGFGVLISDEGQPVFENNTIINNKEGTIEYEEAEPFFSGSFAFVMVAMVMMMTVLFVVMVVIARKKRGLT